MAMLNGTKNDYNNIKLRPTSGSKTMHNSPRMHVEPFCEFSSTDYRPIIHGCSESLNQVASIDSAFVIVQECIVLQLAPEPENGFRILQYDRTGTNMFYEWSFKKRCIR